MDYIHALKEGAGQVQGGVEYILWVEYTRVFLSSVLIRLERLKDISIALLAQGF